MYSPKILFISPQNASSCLSSRKVQLLRRTDCPCVSVPWRSFFSIAIEADAESPACPVEFLASILIRFRAENVRSTEAVDTVMVNAKQTNPAVELVVVSDDLALDLFLQSEARAMSSMAS